MLVGWVAGFFCISFFGFAFVRPSGLREAVTGVSAYEPRTVEVEEFASVALCETGYQQLPFGMTSTKASRTDRASSGLTYEKEMPTGSFVCRKVNLPMDTL
jgi:hypothetical protein